MIGDAETMTNWSNVTSRVGRFCVFDGSAPPDNSIFNTGMPVSRVYALGVGLLRFYVPAHTVDLWNSRRPLDHDEFHRGGFSGNYGWASNQRRASL